MMRKTKGRDVEMSEDSGLKKVLKIAGIVALIAVPVLILMKKAKNQSAAEQGDDDSNIFSSELES